MRSLGPIEQLRRHRQSVHAVRLATALAGYDTQFKRAPCAEARDYVPGTGEASLIWDSVSRASRSRSSSYEERCTTKTPAGSAEGTTSKASAISTKTSVFSPTRSKTSSQRMPGSCAE